MATHALHFAVSDTGIGIPLEKQKLIFDPFTQADTSTTRKYGGNGSGSGDLRAAWSDDGGEIWLKSEVGLGTQFHFTMRVAVANAKLYKPEARAARMLRGVKVLIVDDNRTNRRILERMLEAWQMNPTSAESGEEALAELSAARDNAIHTIWS